MPIPQHVLDEYNLLRKNALETPKFMENNLQRLDFESLMMSFVELTGVQSIFLARKAVLTLYSCGKTSGVVLKSGGFETQLTPVEEGYVRQEGCLGGYMAGNTITKALAHSLGKKGIFQSSVSSWTDWMTYQLAEDIKKRLLSLNAQEQDMDQEF